MNNSSKIIILFIIIFNLISIHKYLSILRYKIPKNKYRKEKVNKEKKPNIYSSNSKETNHSYCKCNSFPETINVRIIHFILTRFMYNFVFTNGFPKKLYNEDYILNGIRVIKKYLFPSLDNQSCKNFTWILIVGDKANITYIKSLLSFNTSFEKEIIYCKDLKNYVRKKARGFDILITTRIDYDDRIYYDAVNDVRKAINVNRPILLYGYNKGLLYYESNNKYYDFDKTMMKNGIWSVFISLIVNLNIANDTFIVHDLGNHVCIRKTLQEKYKSYGIKEINYEPTIIDNGIPKFIYVRQKYSGLYDPKIPRYKRINISNFYLSKFYGI